MAPFSVRVSSTFEEFWRYNIVVMAAVMREGQRVELLKDRIDVAPVGAELTSPPVGYVSRDVMLRSVPADALTLYIYVVPHSLPRVESIAMAEAFDLRVEVMFDDKPLYGHTHEINQWSGENIEIELIEPGYGGHNL